MLSHGKQVSFEEKVFFVDENVYEPAEDSFLFAENLSVSRRDRVLDIGTGCGILGILAAEKASEVLAIDINPFSLRCAKNNAISNEVRGKIGFIQGDLFNPVSEESKFDLILFNAPYLPSGENEVVSWLSRSWMGGPTGRQLIDRFIYEVPKYLKKGGRAFLMQSTLADVDKTIAEFQKVGLQPKIISRLALPFFETIVLIEASLKNSIGVHSSNSTNLPK